jgi:hypothetical protein
LSLSAIDYPYHFATRFLVAQLHSNDVSGLHPLFQASQLGSVVADIYGVSFLGKRTAVRVHSEDPDREVDVNTRLWLVGHSMGSVPACEP